MPLKLMYITNNLDVALIAQDNGVDRIWIDLETLGKEERQKNRDTVKSNHSVNDIRVISKHLYSSEMMVRVNPWNPDSVREITDVIDAGAQIIMLPYWKTTKEVSNFLETVNGKCKTSLLLETKEAVECLDEVLKLDGIDEIHIGLNDLHLSYGLTFMFELLSDGTVERLCSKIKEADIPYGFGGIAKIGQGDVPAENIILEHYRLGSTRAILSRSFCNYEKLKDLDVIRKTFKESMIELREFEEKAAITSQKDFAENKKKLGILIENVVEKKKSSC